MSRNFCIPLNRDDLFEASAVNQYIVENVYTVRELKMKLQDAQQDVQLHGADFVIDYDGFDIIFSVVEAFNKDITGDMKQLAMQITSDGMANLIESLSQILNTGELLEHDERIRNLNKTKMLLYLFCQLIEHIEGDQNEVMVRDFNCNAMVMELMREISRVDGKELARDTGGTNNYAKFLVEMTEKLPKNVLPCVSLLMVHLDGESYSMRKCVLGILGEIVIKVLSSEDLDENNKDLRENFLDVLEDHMHDVSSYVRTRVLEIWDNLCEGKCIPLNRQHRVLELAVGRLQDKSSLVRKIAVRLLTSMLNCNPYAARFNNDQLKEALNFIIILNKSLPVIAQLLGSKQETDILEGIDFFVSAFEFGVLNAMNGVRRMLSLIWSTEKKIKDAVVSAYKRLYINPNQNNARASAATIARNRMALVQGATLGDLTSMERLVSELVASKDIGKDVFKVLWEFSIGVLPDVRNSDPKAAISLLAMAAISEPGIIRSNIEPRQISCSPESPASLFSSCCRQN